MKVADLTLDPREFGSQGSAVLGIRDSGKTYTATYLAERLFDAGIPFIAFDPIGVWRYLRVPGKGKGYPIVVAGGQEGDLPLSPVSAPMIVEAAMQNGVSLVIDLFDMTLSKADWRKIVRDCVRLLLHRNKPHGLRHIFLEEAAEFAPQKVTDGLVYAEIEKLARMGGNSGLGYTLINQRSQEVNKAVLELCDNLFLHRQKGKNSLENLKKWLDIAGATASEVMQTIPTLPQGECWAWLSSSDTPVHWKVPEKQSLHPDRRMMHGVAGALAKKAVKVEKFVTALQKTLPALEEAVKANDPNALRAEIVQLKQKIVRLERSNAPAWPDLREEVARLQKSAAIAPAVRRALGPVQKAVARLIEQAGALEDEIDVIEKVIEGVIPPTGGDREPISPVRLTSPPRQIVASPPAQRERSVAREESNGAVPSGTRPVLSALASVFPAGMTRGQLAAHVGIKKKGSTLSAYLSKLRTAGLLEESDNLLFASEAGAAAVGPIQPLPEPGPALARSWAGKISGTAPVVEYLLERHPEWSERLDIAEALGINPGGSTLSAYISKLFTAGVVAKDGSKVRLSDEVMGA